jgi:hypothetical protein
VKPLILSAVAALALALVTVSCGGGGSSPSNTPPPPTGTFTNASLKGTYSFSMSGTDASANPGAFLARIGSFVADGNGNITMGMEDVLDGNALNSGVQFTGGSYAIQANGKGTLTLNTLSGGLALTIALNSATKGVMIQTDLNATSSGSFTMQSANAFSVTAIAGPYVFDVAGTDGGGAPLSVVGQIVTNGSGGISSGIFDSNDGGLNPPLSPAQTFGAGGSYSFDPTNGTTFGRGTFSFAGRTFTFYLVDSTRIRLLETDGQLFTFGDALQQSGAPTQPAAGSFAFLIGASGVLGTAGPVARGARFTTDASGNLTNIQLQDNDSGTVTAIGNGTTIQNAKFTVDTANAGTGRGTLTFTAASNPGTGTFSFVLYFASASQAFVQDTSNGIVGDGTMLAQTGGISNSSLAGNYAFNWSGVVRPSSANVGFEEDFAGQYAQDSSGNLSGAVDFVEPGTTSNHPLFTNSLASGTLTLSGDGTGSNDYKVTIASAGVSSNTFTFKAFVAGTNTIFLVGTQSNQVLAGSATPQTQ